MAQDVIVRFKAEVADFQKKLNTIEKEMGDIGRASDKTTAKVKGNFKETAASATALDRRLESLGGTLKGSLLTAVGGFGAALSGAFAIQSIVRNALTTIKGFEKSISTLSAITGATGEDLEFLKQQAIAIGSATTLSASQVAEGFKLIASAKPELLENSAALAQVTKEAITLAEAAQLELAPAADALANTLNQFSLGAEESTRVINALAAGSKFGAVAIPGISEAIVKFGTVAASANISVEESVGLIETLGEKGIPAAAAGINLRNVLIKLQSGADETNPKVVGLSTALDNLGKANLSTTELTKRFRAENLVAIQTLIENRDRVDDLTEAVTDTSIAFDQAATNTNNWEGDISKAESAWEGLILRIEDGGGSINQTLRSITQTFTDYITAISLAQDVQAALNGDIDALATTIASGEIDKRLEAAAEAARFMGREFDEAAGRAGILEGAQRNIARTIAPVENALGKQIDVFALSSKEIGEIFPEQAARYIVTQKAIVSQLKQTDAEAKKAAKALGDIPPDPPKTLETLDAYKKKLKELREELEKQAFTGDINNDTLEEYNRILNRLEGSAERLSRALAGISKEDFSKPIEGMDSLNAKTVETADSTEDATDINRDFNTKSFNQLQDRLAREQDIADEDRAKKEAIEQASLEFALGTGQAITDFQRSQEAARTEIALRNLQERLDKGLISEEEFAKKRGELLTAQAEKEKKLAIFDATVNAAGAIIKALNSPVPANFILAGLVGVQTALQIAAIKNEPLPQFAQGTSYVPLGKNKPGVDTVPAMLTAGERVVPKAQNRANWDLYEAIDKDNIAAWVYKNYGSLMHSKPADKKGKSWTGKNLVESDKRTRQILNEINYNLINLNKGRKRLHY